MLEQYTWWCRMDRNWKYCLKECLEEILFLFKFYHSNRFKRSESPGTKDKATRPCILNIDADSEVFSYYIFAFSSLKPQATRLSSPHLLRDTPTRRRSKMTLSDSQWDYAYFVTRVASQMDPTQIQPFVLNPTSESYQRVARGDYVELKCTHRTSEPTKTQRDSKDVIRDLIHDSTLPVSTKDRLVQIQNQQAGSSDPLEDVRPHPAQMLLDRRELSFESAILAFRPRVVDLRNLKEPVKVQHDKEILPKPPLATTPYFSRKDIGSNIVSNIQLRTLTKKTSPNNDPNYHFLETDILLFGNDTDLDREERWTVLGNGRGKSCPVSTHDLPRLIGSESIAICVDKYFQRHVSEEHYRWERAPRQLEGLIGDFRFLRDLPSLDTIYIYWSQCNASFEPKAYRNKYAIPVVVDLYDETQLRELLALDIEDNNHLKQRLCFDCERKKWENWYEGQVKKMWLMLHAEELPFDRLGELLFPIDNVIDVEDPWVKKKLASMPKIRPCVVFDFRL